MTLREQHLVELIAYVPVAPKGEGLSARKIWQRYGRDARTTILHRLRALAERGDICRDFDFDGRYWRWLYRREPGWGRP